MNSVCRATLFRQSILSQHTFRVPGARVYIERPRSNRPSRYSGSIVSSLSVRAPPPASLSMYTCIRAVPLLVTYHYDVRNRSNNVTSRDRCCADARNQHTLCACARAKHEINGTHEYTRIFCTNL